MKSESTLNDERVDRAVSGDEATPDELFEEHRALLTPMVELRIDRRQQGRFNTACPDHFDSFSDFYSLNKEG